MLENKAISVSAAPFDENDRPTIALPPPTSSPTRGHQRSRTTVQLPPLCTRPASVSPTRFSTFLPSLRSASRSTSPERVSIKDAAQFDVDTAKPSIQKHKSSASVAKLASWFDGASDPVNISLVPSERKDPSDTVQDPDHITKMFSASTEDVDTLTKRPSRPPTSSSAQPSRFSFFRKTSQAQLSTPENHEELAHLDIRETLFPAGTVDEFSPSSFKNLQLNAEGSLRRFQNAHIDQQRTIRSVTSAKNVQADELEASQTRNEHLKLQLGEMAERAAEQERLISALRAELDVSRHSHSGMDLQSSIRKVSQNSAPRYQKNRTSDISISESENGSDVVSVFSEPMSAMDSPGTSVAASPVLKHAVMYHPRIHQALDRHAAVIPVPECQKCHGVRSNEAWDVISMMKVESRALKDRIGELEGAHDDALDFLRGLKIVP